MSADRSPAVVASPEGHPRNISLGYLKAFLTLLVVLHHTLLAYASFAPPLQPRLDASLLWTAFPIVDPQRWSIAGLIAGFNDTFFMSLMFLLSGVFAWPSLARKGAVTFACDRLFRLGLPFVLAAALLAPLAYYPTWLASPANGESFWHTWLRLGAWPAGPAWFLWVLLGFGALAALLAQLAPGFGVRLGSITGRLGQHPSAFFLCLVLASALLYLPMAAVFNPLRWLHAGPFFVQISRLPHYLLYFLVGIGIGAHGASRGLLQADGALARRWPLWLLLSLLMFFASLCLLALIFASMPKGGPAPWLVVLGNFSFVLSCASTSFMLLALFTRFVHRAGRVADHLAANAYGIYLLHYAAVTWLQVGLLHAAWPAPAKAGMVFVAAVAASWLVSALLRRIPVIARLL